MESQDARARILAKSVPIIRLRTHRQCGVVRSADLEPREPCGVSRKHAVPRSLARGVRSSERLSIGTTYFVLCRIFRRELEGKLDAHAESEPLAIHGRDQFSYWVLT
jgi:hypothetical protein